MNRALVTGGAGFIGSHVVERLLGEGWEVVVLDDFSSGKEENLAAVIHHKNLHLMRGSILNREIVSESIQGADTIFHEAAIVNVQRSIDDPVAVHRVNVDGTLTLLDEARKADVHNFILASSCGVYGNVRSLPIREDSPLAPQNPYAASKAADEQYCLAYSQTYGLGAVRLRYTNVYGPRRSVGAYAGVMVKFAECITKNMPVIIFGDGTQTRDFIYSTDVAEATICSAECSDASGLAINVGTGIATSINELAEVMFAIAGKGTLNVTRAPPRSGELAHSQVDTRLASKILNFESKVSLEAGLRKFLTWYESLPIISRTS